MRKSLAAALEGHPLFHVAQGRLLMEVGRRAEAHAAQLRALDLTQATADRALLRRRLFS